MKSLRFQPDETGGIASDVLPLRMPQASGIVDPEPFRVRSIDGPALLEPFTVSEGVRTLHVNGPTQHTLFEWNGPLLTFVLSGEVAVQTDAKETLLAPGDLFLVNRGEAIERLFELRGDCRLIQLAVPEDWPCDRARPPRTDGLIMREGQPFNSKRMYKGADDRSYFREFGRLFGPAGQWSSVTPLTGFRFIGMAEDTFIDWHPEIVNNFVIVLSGALELETGGGEGAVEIFRPGDVCLAEDRTGEGHIDRMHGHVQVAVLIVEDEHLWPE